MKFLDHAPRFTGLYSIYLNPKILKLDYLFNFELGKFMLQYYKGKLPNSFEGYFQDIALSHQ